VFLCRQAVTFNLFPIYLYLTKFHNKCQEGIFIPVKRIFLISPLCTTSIGDVFCVASSSCFFSYYHVSDTHQLDYHNRLTWLSPTSYGMPCGTHYTNTHSLTNNLPHLLILVTCDVLLNDTYFHISYIDDNLSHAPPTSNPSGSSLHLL